MAGECSSDCSREMAINLEAKEAASVVAVLLDESEQGLNLLNEGLDLTQDGLPDLREQIQRFRAGAPVTARELLQVRKTLSMSRRTKLAFQGISEEVFPNVRQFVLQLSILDDLVVSIDRVIDESGAVKDDASPQLRGYRRDLLRFTQQIKEELTRLINSPSHSKCLQEPIYTVRNGRHVLPVLANMRQSIDGIVHDSSASGLTIYVEPLSVVELTNKVRITEANIEREIERLLWELSSEASKRVDDIDCTFQTLVELDFIAARAKLARRYEGRKPEILTQAEMRFIKARHPLLILQTGKIEKVIPNDITLGQGLQSVIITGPNTGGKTVYLKTAGLLALMMRAGLLLPVQEHSACSIFCGIFADIGDEQSLEQNLSTFSSHMGNIIEILKRAGEGTLVLLDEIGAGTDPREGVVLAEVILTELKASGALTICSTHYGDLKTLAHSKDGFGNASMEFDEKTLTPSYRMRAGIPGSSKAIAVAAHLGLDPQLVEKAEASLASQKADFEFKIEEIEKRLHVIAEREEELEETEARIRALEFQLSEQKQALEREYRKTKFESASRFEQEYEQAKKLINELTASLQKTPTLARAQESKEKLESIRKELDWLSPEEFERERIKIAPGQTVKVRSLNQMGQVETMYESEEKALVRVGRLKVKVLLNDLEVAAGVTAPKSKTFGRSAASPSSRASSGNSMQMNRKLEDPVFVRSSKNTIDLRGKRVDEAMAEVERFLDSCYREQLSPLMIIHGHGTGAIKGAVRSFLSSCSYANKSRSGENYEGGDGVTVVNFV